MVQVELPDWLAKDAEGQSITQVQPRLDAVLISPGWLPCCMPGCTAADRLPPGSFAQADIAFTDVVAVTAALAVASIDLVANHQIFTLNNLLGGTQSRT